MCHTLFVPAVLVSPVTKIRFAVPNREITSISHLLFGDNPNEEVAFNWDITRPGRGDSNASDETREWIKNENFFL